jgi:hypothetical protein
MKRALFVLFLGLMLLASAMTVQTASASTTWSTAKGTWSPTSSMSTPRSDAIGALLPNGKVLVAGGMDNHYNYLATA